MDDWNLVATTREHRFLRARRTLKELGDVHRTPYHNVLVMKVGDVGQFLDALRARLEVHPEEAASIGRVVPATRTVAFDTPEQLVEEARKIVAEWAPRLAGKRFHVRIHRRGFGGRLSTLDVERSLDDAVLEQLAAAGASAKLGFDDPDAIIAVETVGGRAGLSLWERHELARYPFLHLD